MVSVGEKINEPRYPSFKGIMAAKKKPVATLGLADAGIDASEVGLADALTVGDVVAAEAAEERGREGRPTRATAARRSPRTWSSQKLI